MNFTWVDAAGGFFGDSNNWNPPTVPGVGDDAFFDLSASYVVDLDSDVLATPRVRSGDVVFELNSFSVVPTVDVGGSSVATIRGGSVHGGLRVASEQSSSGGLDVSGAGTRFQGGANLADGFNSSATLTVANGALGVGFLHVARGEISTATVSVTGLSTQWLGSSVAVGSGRLSQGALSISDAATFSASSSVTIGGFEGSGELNVTGGAQLSASSISVGAPSRESTGSMLIDENAEVEVTTGDLQVGAGTGSIGSVVVRNGGSLVAQDVKLGQGAADNSQIAVLDGATVMSRNVDISPRSSGGLGIGMVSGIGSSWVMDFLELDGSSNGDARFVVSDGAFATSAGALINTNNGGVSVTNSAHWEAGRAPTDTLTMSGPLEILSGGRVTTNGGAAELQTLMARVSGTGSMLDVGPLSLSGILEVTAGGRVSSLGAVVAPGASAFGLARVIGAGSVWEDTSTSGIQLGPTPTGFASLMVADQGVVRAQKIDIGPGGEVVGNGTIEANVENSGLLRPGLSPGDLTILGDFSQTATGKLVIELEGTVPGTGHDRLSVSGNALLGGILSVSILDGLLVQPGDTFEILTASTISGAFDLVDMPELGGGLSLDLTIGPSGIGVNVVPEPSTALLLACGLAALAVGRRRRRV